MNPLTDNQLHELARKRVEFRQNLLAFVIVNAAFWIVWFFTGQGYIWPIWITASWSIGVVFHYFFYYRPTTLFSEDEEFNKLKKRLRNE